MKWIDDNIECRVIGLTLNDDDEATFTIRCVENEVVAVYRLDLTTMVIVRSGSKLELVYAHHVAAIMSRFHELQELKATIFEA